MKLIKFLLLSGVFVWCQSSAFSSKDEDDSRKRKCIMVNDLLSYKKQKIHEDDESDLDIDDDDFNEILNNFVNSSPVYNEIAGQEWIQGINNAILSSGGSSPYLDPQNISPTPENDGINNLNYINAFEFPQDDKNSQGQNGLWSTYSEKYAQPHNNNNNDIEITEENIDFSNPLNILFFEDRTNTSFLNSNNDITENRAVTNRGPKKVGLGGILALISDDYKNDNMDNITDEDVKDLALTIKSTVYSGKSFEAICRNIRSNIQDESGKDKSEILRRISNICDSAYRYAKRNNIDQKTPEGAEKVLKDMRYKRANLGSNNNQKPENRTNTSFLNSNNDITENSAVTNRGSKKVIPFRHGEAPVLK